MEVKREPKAKETPTFRPQVSILVLMEVKREKACRRPFSCAVQGFNPCFDGSEARANGAASTTWASSVSILVLMEVKREVCMQRGREMRNMFQSLF